ncbi:flagellin [Paeniglutamicibacter psychrophenolicus]
MDKIVNALNGDTNFAKNFTATKNDAGELVVKSTTGAVVDTDTAPGAGLTGVVQGAVGSLDFSTAAGAQAAISAIDIEITGISSARAELGAKQNRFESAINSLNVSRENLQAAESRIRDVDMAAEMVNFTRSNILSQAGTAMLAQANQSNQGVLQLLG